MESVKFAQYSSTKIKLQRDAFQTNATLPNSFLSQATVRAVLNSPIKMTQVKHANKIFAQSSR